MSKSKKEIKRVNPDLLGEFVQLQWEHKQAFLNRLQNNPQELEYSRDIVNNFEQEMAELDNKQHYARCKLLARWLDDTWQHDTKITHHSYMDQLSKAIDLIRNDTSQVLRDAVLFTYYPEFALKEFVNWYDEDAEEAMTKMYGTKEEKKVLDIKSKLRQANQQANRENLKNMLARDSEKKH